MAVLRLELAINLSELDSCEDSEKITTAIELELENLHAFKAECLKSSHFIFINI